MRSWRLPCSRNPGASPVPANGLRRPCGCRRHRYPAILALEDNGFTVTQEADLIVARAGNTRFAAEDPVTVLGLVKLAETRRPWRADDQEIDDVLGRFSP